MDTPVNLESFGYQQEFKRTLGLRDLVLFGFVFLGPIGALTMFGVIASASGGNNVLSCLMAFTAILFTAYSYGKMSQAFPVAGSAYSYTQRALHPKAGFLFGWVILLDYCIIPCLVYSVQCSYGVSLVPWIPFWGWLLLQVAIVTLINYVGVKVLASVDLIFSVLMFIAAFVVVFACAKYAFSLPSLDLMLPVFNPATTTLSNVTAGSVIALMVYIGFDAMTTMAEETINPEKNIMRALFISCTLFTVVIVLVYYFGMLAWPDWKTFPDATTAMNSIARKVGGVGLELFVQIVVMVTGLGILMTANASASRLLFGMGRDGIFPKAFFGHVHPVRKTPDLNILLMGAIAVVIVLLVPIQYLAEMVSFGALTAFTGVNVACISHYFLKSKTKKMRHLIIPSVGACVCLYMLFGMSSLAKTVGLIWVGIGILYLMTRTVMDRNFGSLLEQELFRES